MTVRLDEAIDALAFAVSLVPLGDNLDRIGNTLDVADRAILEAKFALDRELSLRRQHREATVFLTHPHWTQAPVVTPRPPTLDDLTI